MHDGGKHLVERGVRRDDDCQDTDAGCMCCVVDYHLVPDGVVYCRVDYIYRDLHGWRVSELVQPFDVLSSADGQKLERVLSMDANVFASAIGTSLSESCATVFWRPQEDIIVEINKVKTFRQLTCEQFNDLHIELIVVVFNT